MTRDIFRFAPSPTGALHLGHALSALLNQDAARAANGRLLLRIEDTDLGRCTPENEAGILRDLGWLGLRWEEPVRRQSEHFDDYRAALERLIDMDLVYPAFLTRSEIRAAIAAKEAGGAAWPRDPDGVPHYPPQDRARARAASRTLDGDGTFAWRIDMERAVAKAGPLPSWHEEGLGPRGETGTVTIDPRAWGDVIVARKEFPASYTLAVVVDDALQNVSTVIRGQDLFYATAVHRLLQTLLDLPAPRYRHHRLILGEDGRKLSKSRGDLALAALRQAGETPDDIRRRVGLA